MKMRLLLCGRVAFSTSNVKKYGYDDLEYCIPFAVLHDRTPKCGCKIIIIFLRNGLHFSSSKVCFVLQADAQKQVCFFVLQNSIHYVKLLLHWNCPQISTGKKELM